MTTTTVKDPVCGMEIDPKSAAGTSEFGSETIYFCSPGCKEKFDAAPEEYAANGATKKMGENKQTRQSNGLTTKQATDGTHNNHIFRRTKIFFNLILGE